MARKLGKSSYPTGHGPNDFQCFGPPALEDGNFDTCKIADMGSFSQDDKDSNKYYHAAVVKSKINGQWYTYFEWGRVGAKAPQFQMIECASEAECRKSSHRSFTTRTTSVACGPRSPVFAHSPLGRARTYIWFASLRPAASACRTPKPSSMSIPIRPRSRTRSPHPGLPVLRLALA